MSTPRFKLGQCRASQGALGALEDNETFAIVYLKRHESGDWGELEARYKQRNEAAIQDCGRIFSRYRLADGQTIYITTDADRSETTILLNSEIHEAPRGTNDGN